VAGTKAIKQAATRSLRYFFLIAFTFKFESLERFQEYVPFTAVFYINGSKQSILMRITIEGEKD